MKYKLDSLNLSSNSKFNGGFDPETINDVVWYLNLSDVRISSTEIVIRVSIEAPNLKSERAFTHIHTGDTSLGINSMADFVSYMYGLILAEDEFKDSTLV